LFALCALGVLLGQFQTRARVQGVSDPVSKTMTMVVAPVGQVWVNGARATGDFGYGLMNARRLTEENRDLRNQALIIQTYDEAVSRLARELESLERVNDLPTYGENQKIIAPVWAYSPVENRLTLGRGSSSGIRKGLPVVSPDGLVGLIQTVDANTSQVQLVTSPLPFRIGAMIDSPNPAPGLLHGEAADRLVIEFTDMNLTMKSGDLVVTSGFSQFIPRGIPIGRVVQVKSDPEFGKKTAQIFPFFKVGELRQVAVLR
jgi:rod shape-determining protein MreC